MLISEAGRVLSKKNEGAIKAALDALKAVLAQLGVGGNKATVTEATRQLAEAQAVLKQSDSIDGRRDMLRKAIRAKLKDPLNSENPYVWVREYFDAACIYERDDDQGISHLYQVPYSIDSTSGAPVVLLGEPFEVEVAYVPKTAASGPTDVQESDQDLEVAFIPLVEKAVRQDGSISIKLIDPGWGSSGYYPAAVLKRDGPRVFTAGTKMYWNHPTPQEEAQRPERDLRDLAAVLTGNARWEDAGADGPGLYSDAKVYEAYRAPVNDLSQDIGVSIRAFGRAKPGEAEGRKGPIIESIVGARSTDFVTDPGRGGKILQLFEAARGGGAPPSNGKKEEESMAMTEAEQKQLQEATSAVTKLTEANTMLQTTLETQSQQLARLSEAAILREAREFVSTKVPATLPELTRQRLIESLGLRPTIKDSTIDREAFGTVITEAVKAEVAYLAQVTGSGVIRGMGGSDFSESAGGAPKPEDVNKSLEESFRTLGLSESGAKIAAQGR